MIAINEGAVMFLRHYVTGTLLRLGDEREGVWVRVGRKRNFVHWEEQVVVHRGKLFPLVCFRAIWDLGFEPVV